MLKILRWSNIEILTLIQCWKYYVDPIFKSNHFHKIDPTSKDNVDPMMIQRLVPAGNGLNAVSGALRFPVTALLSRQRLQRLTVSTPLKQRVLPRTIKVLQGGLNRKSLMVLWRTPFTGSSRRTLGIILKGYLRRTIEERFGVPFGEPISRQTVIPRET